MPDTASHFETFDAFVCKAIEWQTNGMRKTIYFIEKNPPTFGDEKHASAKQLLFALYTHHFIAIDLIPLSHSQFPHWKSIITSIAYDNSSPAHIWAVHQIFEYFHHRSNVLFRILAID